MTTNQQCVPALDVYGSAGEMREAQRRGGEFICGGHAGGWTFDEPPTSYLYIIGSDPQEPGNKHTKEQPLTINQPWVPALDVYPSAKEMLQAQARGGRFKCGVRSGNWFFVGLSTNYFYLLGSDPQEPANKRTKEQPMQPEQSRMDYLIDCARQVLDGKTSQWMDGSEWQSNESIHDALGAIADAMRDPTLQVRIKPEPVVYPSLFIELLDDGVTLRCLSQPHDAHTYKLTITDDDGKVSATIEELGK